MLIKRYTIIVLLNYRFIFSAFFAVILLLTVTIGGQYTAYAERTNPPSFGGGSFLKYSDGLVINGQVIDASKYSQKMDVPIILPLGQSSTITLKIFDNRGPTTIKAAALYGNNIRGANLATSTGDTSIVYFVDKKQVTVTDPNKLFGTVTAQYTIVKPYIYVTFHVTPVTKFDTSNLSIAAMDDKKSFTTSLLLNAIKVA
jgi:hypothetical protein